VPKDSPPAQPATERRIHKDLKPAKSLAQILQDNNVLSLWLAGQKTRKTDVLISFIEGLPDLDREALLKQAHLIVGIDDDLFEKLYQLTKENNHLRSLTLTDPLTDLYKSHVQGGQGSPAA
jgi:hypothetical protein